MHDALQPTGPGFEDPTVPRRCSGNALVPACEPGDIRSKPLAGGRPQGLDRHGRVRPAWPTEEAFAA